jgi:hypothetical protein
MAEVASLVRELVPEKLFAGEVLEIRIVDPALANVLVGGAGSRRPSSKQGKPCDHPCAGFRMMLFDRSNVDAGQIRRQVPGSPNLEPELSHAH